MKKLISTFCIAALLVSCGTSQKSSSDAQPKAVVNIGNPADYATSITSAELKEMLYTYASDEFEGRDTGSKGQKMAIEYIKAQYIAMGIPSPLSGGNYFQDVPLEKQKVAEAKVSVNGKAFNSFDHHIVLALSKSMDLNIEDITYVGYGIDADNYSDYKNIDVKGKIVLAKGGEPQDENGNYMTSGKPEDTKWSTGRQSIASKREAALANGAKALLFMEKDLFPRYAPFYKRQAESGAAGRLSLKSKEEGLLFMMINEDLGKALHASISEDDTPKLIKTNMTIAVENNTENVDTENVLAYIKGSEKPDEVIVLSAHLDHEGIKDGKIYNGADDDGSGTVALIEIAEALRMAEKAGHGPKRSVLFLHVTAEEKGLLGSRYYTDMDPIFPLENTVANLNIDMVGRIDSKRTEGDRNYIYLIGSDKLSTELHQISEEVNKKYMNVELDYTYNDENDPNRYYYRSDHYNFAKNNIPIIFYFNGTHDDYHKPSDTPDKIEYDLLENRTRLVFHTTWELANRDQRIVADKAEAK